MKFIKGTMPDGDSFDFALPVFRELISNGLSKVSMDVLLEIAALMDFTDVEIYSEGES